METKCCTSTRCERPLERAAAIAVAGRRYVGHRGNLMQGESTMKPDRIPHRQLVRVWPYLSLIVLLVAGAGCSSNEPAGSLPTVEKPPGGLPTAPAFSVVAGSTQKICQLTGEYDYHEAAKAGVAPEEKPILRRGFNRPHQGKLSSNRFRRCSRPANNRMNPTRLQNSDIRHR